MITFPTADADQDLFKPETTAVLRDLYVDYARRLGVSDRFVQRCLAVFGGSLCGYQPGNITLEPQGRK